MIRLSSVPLELLCWVSALLYLALLEPGGDHFTLCPLANLGFSWCPGCGLGRSVSSLLHADFASSLHYHWLGLPALIILLHRISVLLKNSIKSITKPIINEP